MFEFDKYERNLHNDPPAAPSARYEQAVRACAVEENGFAEGMLLRLAEPLTCDFIRINCVTAKDGFHASPSQSAGLDLTLVRSARKMSRSQCRRHVS
jgi:hypothetical protein